MKGRFVMDGFKHIVMNEYTQEYFSAYCSETFLYNFIDDMLIKDR